MNGKAGMGKLEREKGVGKRESMGKAVLPVTGKNFYGAIAHS